MRPDRLFGLELRGLGEHVVRPLGDLTEATAPALCRSVAVPLSNGAPRIVLDLSMTRRIDAGGRRALIECSRAVRCAHGTLALVSAPGYVRDLFRASDAEHDAQARMAAEVQSEVDELGEQRHRLESTHGRRVCAVFVSRTTTGHPLLCGLTVGHSGTHQWH